MVRNPMTPFRSGGMSQRGFGDPFLSLHREMNRLFDDVFNDRLGGAPTAGSQQNGGVMMPDIDVSETDKELKICAELPGVSEDEVDVSLDEDLLTIRGEKKFERRDEKENYHFVERSYGTFQRSIRLPYRIDPEKVQANFDKGVLTIRLQKGRNQEKTRKIQVRPGGQQESVADQSKQGDKGKRAGSSGSS